MILEKKIDKLSGFVNPHTIKKYIDKNYLLTKKNSYYNIQKIIISIVIFCVISFLSHVYQLYTHKPSFNYLSIVPRSGLY